MPIKRNFDIAVRSGIFFAFCENCPDINEESGDPQEGELQLSGWGANREQADSQTEGHLMRFPSHTVRIERI